MDKMEICKENVGFLTLRRCDKPSVGKCVLCKKPVCQEHGPHTASGEVACLTCMRTREAELNQRGDAPARQDREVPLLNNYGSYYYDDYSPYSVHDRFNEKDYSTFRGDFNAEDPDGAKSAEGFEGS